jgi:hypothetical protein
MEQFLQWLIGIMPIAALVIMGSDWIVSEGYGPYLVGFSVPIAIILIVGGILYLDQPNKKSDNPAGP